MKVQLLQNEGQDLCNACTRYSKRRKPDSSERSSANPGRMTPAVRATLQALNSWLPWNHTQPRRGHFRSRGRTAWRHQACGARCHARCQHPLNCTPSLATTHGCSATQALQRLGCPKIVWHPPQTSRRPNLRIPGSDRPDAAGCTTSAHIWSKPDKKFVPPCPSAASM